MHSEHAGFLFFTTASDLIFYLSSSIMFMHIHMHDTYLSFLFFLNLLNASLIILLDFNGEWLLIGKLFSLRQK